ncbi:MAG: hypothetical protein EA423_07820 [Phycisphaerales bacterium]|nr:MAG: hypothetical protein EA423_07820 [Phycisphaerales bacterium]
MPIPSIEKLLAAPAPGLAFEMHVNDKPKRVVLPSPHKLGKPASETDLGKLRALAKDMPEHEEMVRLYGAHDGVKLFNMSEGGTKYTKPAVELLPIGKWQKHAEEFLEMDILEECYPGFYDAGDWAAIGTIEAEGTTLIYFFDGEYNSEPLAGRIFPVMLDPVMDCDELLAPSLPAFLGSLAADPTEILGRLEMIWDAKIGGEDLIGNIVGWTPDAASDPDTVLPGQG